MNNGLAARRRSVLARARKTKVRLESILDGIRASANPLEPSLLAELRVFLETEGLPSALEYERLILGERPHALWAQDGRPDPAA